VGVRPTPIIHQDQSPVVKQIVLALKQLLSKRNDLRELSIEKIPLFIPPLIELGNALEQQTCRLSYLSLSGCQIGDLGFSKLQRFLSRRDVVSRLDLSGCDLSPVAMTIIIDTLKARMLRGSGQFWRENLRNATDHVEESHFNGIRVLKLNENARLADSITPLLTAIIYDDLRCLERVELRRCEIAPNPKLDSVLEDMLDKIPSSLSVLDLRQNPIMQNETSRNLVQILMSKLLIAHPKTEYDSVRLTPRSDPNETITKVRGFFGARRSISMGDLSNAYSNGERHKSKRSVAKTTGKMTDKKGKKMGKRVLGGSTETPDSNSDIDSPIDTEYCDLPGTKEKSRVPRNAPTENVDENGNLHECLKLEQAARERERQRRRDSELKYSQLSSRISTLEHILQDKDDQIQSLLAEKEGHVLVEENLLRTIENSFSKFQDFLGMLNELGLSQLTELEEFRELNELASMK